MSPSFNLISDVWIPCYKHNKEIKLLSIIEALTNAHELIEIRDQSPIVTLSIYRLLFALLHRVYEGPTTKQQWLDIYERKQFDIELFEEYFKRCDDNGVPLVERFNLFGDTPFFQDITLNDEKDLKKDAISITNLTRDYSSGTNKTLFDHSVEDNPPVLSFAHCSRYLIATQFYAMQDGAGYQASAISGGAIIQFKRDTLFDTLLLNLCLYDDDTPFESDADDKPIWEYEYLYKTDDPHGYLSYLTWQYRRVLLLQNSDENNGISKVYRTSATRPSNEWLETSKDPFICYREIEKKGWVPYNIRKDKSCWRDCHSFHDYIKTNKEKRFSIFLTEDCDLSYQVIGVNCVKNRIDLCLHDQFPLSIELVENETLKDILSNALLISEKTDGKIKYIFTKVLKKEEVLDDDILKILSDKTLQHYWSSLEPHFHELYLNIPKDANAAIDQWVSTIKQVAKESLEETLRGLDRSARSMQATVRARSELHYRLNEKLSQKEVA